MKLWHWLLGIVGIVFVLGLCYNSLVLSSNNVNAKMSLVQVQEKRRADLVPNLVEAVKDYKIFEKDVILGVTEARAKVGQLASMDPARLASDPALLKQLSDAQAQIGSVFSRLIAVSENYPNLKASELYKDLMAGLEGTENRIGTARHDYVVAVQSYNNTIGTLPGVLYAGALGFYAKAQFETSEADRAPVKVKFN